MSRVLAIDYGAKRIGLAVTDPMQIIATALETVPNQEAIKWLKDYMQKESVEQFVIGDPKHLNGERAEIATQVDNFAKQLEKHFPGIPIERIDERFTSKMASQAMVMSGMKKKDRQNKANIDKISATLILQTYMEKRMI